LTQTQKLRVAKSNGLTVLQISVQKGADTAVHTVIFIFTLVV